MKFLSHIAYPYSARYYNFTTTNTDGEDTFNYFYEDDINFGGSSSGGRLVMYSKSLLRVNAQLDTITTTQGELIMLDENYPDTGATYRITSAEPVLSYFGTREHYKYYAVRVE